MTHVGQRLTPTPRDRQQRGDDLALGRRTRRSAAAVTQADATRLRPPRLASYSAASAASTSWSGRLSAVDFRAATPMLTVTTPWLALACGSASANTAARPSLAGYRPHQLEAGLDESIFVHGCQRRRIERRNVQDRREPRVHRRHQRGVVAQRRAQPQPMPGKSCHSPSSTCQPIRSPLLTLERFAFHQVAARQEAIRAIDTLVSSCGF